MGGFETFQAAIEHECSKVDNTIQMRLPEVQSPERLRWLDDALSMGGPE